LWRCWLATSSLKESRATKAARRIVQRFDAGLDDEVKDDNRYDFRVRIYQTTGPKSQADAAFEFVKLDALSPEERGVMEKAGKAGKVVTKLKSVPVAADGTMLPGAVLATVNAKLPFDLALHQHTMLWKHFSVRPSGWTAPGGGACVTQYSLPLTPTRNYVEPSRV